MVNSNELSQAELSLVGSCLFDYITQGISSEIELDFVMLDEIELDFD